MSLKLKNFLIDLALNPIMKTSYDQDAIGTMERAGLTEQEREAMASGDSARLRAALGRPDNDCMSQVASTERAPRGSLIRRPNGTLIMLDEDIEAQACELSEESAKALLDLKDQPARDKDGQ